MPGPRNIVIYWPSPRAFPVVQKPWAWPHILVQKPWGAQGGMVTGQIDAYFTRWNLPDRFFCVHAMYEYEYFMGVKGYFHIVPDSETERPRNQSSMNKNTCSVDLQVSHLLKIEQSSPAAGPGYWAEIVPKVAFLL